jgi:hypothetical protein
MADHRRRKSRRSTLLPGAERLTEGFIEIVFLLLGVGVLLPWNAFISAKPYFQARLCGDNDPVARNIELWFSVIYNGASVLSLAVLLAVQFFQDTGESNSNTNTNTNNTASISTKLRKSLIQHPMSSPSSRISVAIDPSHGSSEYTWYMVMVPLAIYLGVFVFTTVLVFLPAIPPPIFLTLTLSGLFICGVCTSVASSGIVGTAGLFEPTVGVNPYFNGQAVGGLFVAGANLAATIFNGAKSFRHENCSDHRLLEEETGESGSCLGYSEVNWATVVYFGLGCVVLGSCMLGYSYVDQYKRIVRTAKYPPVPLLEITEEELELLDAEENEHRTHFNIDESNFTTQERRTSKWVKRPTVSFGTFEENENCVSTRDADSSKVSDESDSSQQNVTMSVWAAVQGPAISLFWTYFVTLALFPVWTSELSSTRLCESMSRIRNDLFTPISFVIFNAGDLAGRMVSANIPIEKIRNLSPKLVVSSIVRLFFFPLFLCCAAQSSQYTSLLVHSDVFSWAVQFFFAASNGILTNVAFCYAPGLVANSAHPQQVASVILNFSLSFGLLCGSFFSFPFLGFATGEW